MGSGGVCGGVGMQGGRCVVWLGYWEVGMCVMRV